MDMVAGIPDRISGMVHSGDINECDVMSVGQKLTVFGSQDEVIGVVRCNPDIRHDFLPGSIISDCLQYTGDISGFP
jgi:hypothetical protein